MEFSCYHFLCPCSFPSLNLVSQTASVQRNKKTLTSFFVVSFDSSTVCLSVPTRELYWNSFLCEFLIAIHWWRLSRKGQIRTQSTTAARRPRLKIDFSIRSEKQFIWNVLHVFNIYIYFQSVTLLSVETQLCLIYSLWSFTWELVFLSLCLLTFMFGHIFAQFCYIYISFEHRIYFC